MHKRWKRIMSWVLACALLCSISSVAMAAELDDTGGQMMTAEEEVLGDQLAVLPEETLNEPAQQPEAPNDDSAKQKPEGESQTADAAVENQEADTNEELTEATETVEATEEFQQAQTVEDDPSDEWIAPGVWSDEDPYFTDETPAIVAPSSTLRRAVARVAYPTYEEAYNIMIGLQSKYPEGEYFDNFTPYGSKTESTVASDKIGYIFQGGAVKGARYNVGCAAFCAELNDAVFGSVACRVLDYGQFTYDDLHVSDILRMGGHSVIILKKASNGIIVAEANYNKSVHWGRAISWNEVMSETDFVITRYPVDYSEPGNPDEIVARGTESGFSWTISAGGVLNITGSGSLPDFDSRPNWESAGQPFYSVVIGDGITRIGNSTFFNQSNLAEAYLPDGLVSIGTNAFNGTGLMGITIPSSVKVIDDDAFRLCESLTSATISEGLETIGERAFRASGIRYIDFPSTIKTVGSGAFADCQSLLQVRFMYGSGGVVMGDDIFSNCWYLNYVLLPTGLSNISPGMFASCQSLGSLFIPATVNQLPAAGQNSPFTAANIGTIYFGGTEAQWQKLVADASTQLKVTLQNIPVQYDIPDPLAPDPNDPESDMINPCINGHIGEEGEDGNCTVCGEPFISGPSVDPEDPTPTKHQHSWSASWTHDGTAHWHECATADCPITVNDQKDGYGVHDYGEWVIDLAATANTAGSQHRDCAICSYRQTETIPATGGSSSGDSGNTGGDSGDSGNTGNPGNSGSSSSGSSGSGSSGSTQKPGSSATVSIDKTTGIKVETVQKTDGSKIETTSYAIGNTVIVTTDASGKVSTEVKLADSVVANAVQKSEPIVLPIAKMQAGRDVVTASPLTVYAGKNATANVVIPVTNPTVGTVAVLMNADGSSSIIKTSVSTKDGIITTVANGATLKIIDNGKNFTDVTVGSWAEQAITFATARELFAGTSADTFSPNSPMTRGMLMTVLARFYGADTSGGETWYAKGVEWAKAQGISDGTNPNGDITREQLIAMLWRYVGSPTVVDEMKTFTDQDQISGYANDAMRWAVSQGIINGYGNGRLDPQGQATRAQVAQILKNLIETMAQG